MFDFSSVPPSSSTAKQPSESTAIQFINPNLILQRTLQQISASQRSAVALRCEELPFVIGDEHDWQHIFTQLLKMVFGKQKPSKLFLHIHCTSECKEAAETNPEITEKLFSIQFNTNVHPTTEWLQNNEQCIREVTAILQKYGGHLAVNQTKKPGCIFSLTLPRKHF